MKKMLLSMIVGAVAGVVFVIGGSEAHASETDGIWIPRTVDQIKADIAKYQGNKYTIVWGDTLSGISQATNITTQKLAELNKIVNVDLIYAGNTLTFDGNVVTAKNNKGETVAQSVVTSQDKNDENKPVGKQEPAKQAEEKAQGTTASSGKTVISSQEMSGAVSDTNSSQTVTSGSVEGVTSSTAGTTVSPGIVETPAQPSKPADNQPTQSDQSVEKPTSPTQSSTSGEQGGSTTIQAVDPSAVVDQEPIPAMIGNSGKVFNSEEEAMAYGWKEIKDENSKWFGYGFGVPSLLNKDHDPINKWSVDFYETDQ